MAPGRSLPAGSPGPGERRTDGGRTHDDGNSGRVRGCSSTWPWRQRLGPGPDPLWSELGRRRAACPGPVIYGPGGPAARGSRRPGGPGSIIHRFRPGSGARSPQAPSSGGSPSSSSKASCLTAAGKETPDTGLPGPQWLRLRRVGPKSVTLSPVDIRVRVARARPLGVTVTVRPGPVADSEPGRGSVGTRQPADAAGLAAPARIMISFRSSVRLSF